MMNQTETKATKATDLQETNMAAKSGPENM